MISAQQALQRLKDGNERFVGRTATLEVGRAHERRVETMDSQAPFAIILGCSDSRVPAEMVFDQGLGDLFVIRIAGNIVASSQIGSIEFAADKFGARLVVVLGHTSCGAIQATLETENGSAEVGSPNLGFIVEAIRPGLEGLSESGLEGEQLLEAAVRENIRVSVNKLRRGSAMLERLIDEDGLRIVGAEYSLVTGEVHFLES